MSSEDPQEAIRRELEDLFNYNPPPIHRSENPPEYRPPFTFFDRHIDSRLSLQRVVLLPSFSRELAQVVDREIQALERDGKKLPLISYDYKDIDDRSSLASKGSREQYATHDHVLIDAAAVARFYSQVSYYHCSAVGSTLSLHPGSHTWLSVVDFGRSGVEADQGRSAMTHQYHLRICRDRDRRMCVPKGIWKCLHEEAQAGIFTLFERFRTLVAYQFFAASEEYDSLLEKMSEVAKHRSFTPLPPSVTSSQLKEVSLPVIVDASMSLPGLPQDERKPSFRSRTTQPHDQGKEVPRRKRSLSTPKEKQTSAPVVTVRTSKVDSSDMTKFIQHAWTRAVLDDATFIVFFCGKYERIGVRHRGSRTLFISDLIDVQNCRNPGYSKIQAGLYLLIIKDAMDRASQIQKLEKMPKIPRTMEEKPLDDVIDGSKAVTRRKTRSVKALIVKENALVLEECTKRNLALLHISRGPFDSPLPAAFMRSTSDSRPLQKGRPSKPTTGATTEKYHAHEYIELHLTTDYESGATGQVHRTNLRLTLPDGRILSRAAIVKIAFHQYQRERLRHEYIVYKYMATRGVKCVATIFGLFEDVEDESSVLIMADAGVSLYDRELRRKPGAKSVEHVTVTREERDAFKQALSEIHDAGVRHYDIRPMNLLVDEEGSATIIDFDMAKIGAGEHSRKREYDDLCLLLSGRYFPPNQYPSSATTQSTCADSDILQDI